MKNYIKKIKLETVEALIGENLKPHSVSIGFDVSMYSTGIAIIRTTDIYLIVEKVHKIKVPKLAKYATTKQRLDNVNLFLSQLDDFKREVAKEYTLDINRIEDCFMGQNVKTLKALARYGILVYDRFRSISKDVDMILPTPARSKIHFKKSGKKVKGDKLKKEIMNHVNTILDTNIKETDIADAVVLALAGLVLEGE